MDNNNDGSKRTLLVVDDNPEWVIYIRMLLGTARYRYVFACNGKEAIEKLSSAEPRVDAVLTDTNMPDMDGVELVKNINEKYPNLFVVIFFSYYKQDLDITRDQLFRMGVDVVLRKDEVSIKLRGLVDALLGEPS